jgi:hypothetical protein
MILEGDWSLSASWMGRPSSWTAMALCAWLHSAGDTPPIFAVPSWTAQGPIKR